MDQFPRAGITFFGASTQPILTAIGAGGEAQSKRGGAIGSLRTDFIDRRVMDSSGLHGCP